MIAIREKRNGSGAWLQTAVITAVSILLFYSIFRVVFSIVGWNSGTNLDWYKVYYPALNTVDPFAVYGYFNPPWLAWILSPLGLLSATESHALWVAIIITLTARCVYVLGGNWLAVLLTVTSPGFIITLVNGQVDILVLLGLITGSWLLILIKPQVAGMAVVYDVLVERRVDWTAVFVATFSLIVFLLFMTWPDRSGLVTQANITPWPRGIPVGVALFAVSVYRRDKWLAAMTTFFFTPYLSGSSLLVYSAICTSRYGRVVAVLFSVALWVLCIGWFVS